MSNAVVVTQAPLGGGHFTALFLTTGGFCVLWPSWAHGNKFVWLVPSLVLRVRLCHTETEWRRAGAALPWSVAVLHVRPLQPSLGCLGILAWVCRMINHGGVHSNPYQMDGASTVGCKIQWTFRHVWRKATRERGDHLSSILPSYFQNPFTCRDFTRPSSSEGWAWITNITAQTSARWCLWQRGLSAGRAFENANRAERRRHL